MARKEIWLAGFPSFFGGADTEADNNIDLWRRNDVDVNLVPMFGFDEKMKKLVIARGCKVHDYRPDIFKDKVVASFCNGEFLRLLPEIMEKGRPRAVVWFNCMTWTFDNEVKAHQQGWITYHGFVSNYQKGWLKPQLDKVKPVNEFVGYKPYFNPQNISQQIEFNYRPPDKYFALGRISRDDGNKYSDDMWNIFYKVNTPIHKKVFILGYGPNAHNRTGPAPGSFNIHAPEVRNLMNHAKSPFMRILFEKLKPQPNGEELIKEITKATQGLQTPVTIIQDIQNVLKLNGVWCRGLDWQAWGPNEVPVKQIYGLLHCIIHKTGGSRESYCRIVPEAYAFGVPMIVEDDYAFPDLIVDGVTGFRCKSSDEMSFHASELAFDEEKRKKMIFAAREFLLNEIASPVKCWEPWKKMFEEQGMTE